MCRNFVYFMLDGRASHYDPFLVIIISTCVFPDVIYLHEFRGLTCLGTCVFPDDSEKLVHA